MGRFAVALLVAALACEAFAWWGLSTPAGRLAFDEMAGMIPLAAIPVGGVMALGAIVVLWRRRARAVTRGASSS
jgi:hypothetical protein